MEYDVAVVGGGPAASLRRSDSKQLQPELTVCVLEKGSTIGAHSLSGAVIEPGPLDALLPEWRNAPLPHLGAGHARRIPHAGSRTAAGACRGCRRTLHNHGNFIISLGGLVAWLARRPKRSGVDVFAGFAAALPLFDDDGSVVRRADRRHGRAARRQPRA